MDGWIDRSIDIPVAEEIDAPPARRAAQRTPAAPAPARRGRPGRPFPRHRRRRAGRGGPGPGKSEPKVRSMEIQKNNMNIYINMGNYDEL